MSAEAIRWLASVKFDNAYGGVMFRTAYRGDKDGWSDDTVTALAGSLCLTERSVKRIIASLVGMGVLVREGGGGRGHKARMRLAIEVDPRVISARFAHLNSVMDDTVSEALNGVVNDTLSASETVTPKSVMDDTVSINSDAKEWRTRHRLELNSKDARAPASLTPVVPELTSPSPVKASSVKEEDVPISAEIGARLKIVDSNFSPPGVPEIPPDKPKRPNAVAMVLDEFDRCGMERPVMTGQDTAAIKAAFNSGRPWLPLAVVIVDCYGSVQRREWPPGDTWLANNLSVHTVIGRVAAYEAWLKQGKPTPPTPPYRRNGTPQGSPMPRGDEQPFTMGRRIVDEVPDEPMARL